MLPRSPECALGYPEACTDPTCSDPVHLPGPGRGRGVAVGRRQAAEARRCL